MESRGHVTPRGRPLVEKLSSSVSMIKVSVGPMDNNAYLLQPQQGPGVLIDAANDHDRLLGLLAGQPLQTIVTTHRHGDHWQALGRVAAATNARLVAGQPDIAAIAEGTGVQALTGVWDGDRIELGEEFLEVIGLVGHTPGSIALAYAGGPSYTSLHRGQSVSGWPGQDDQPDRFRHADE